MNHPTLFLIGSCVLSALAARAALPGPIAEWTFDEGSGTVARDSSGSGQDAEIHGAIFEPTGEGFALRLDGEDDYVVLAPGKKLPITGPVSVEAWIQPTRKAEGEAHLLGEGMSQYSLSWYNTELCLFYLGSGGNNLKDYLNLHQWQHVAAAYDGKTMNLWLNGRLAASRESTEPGYEATGNFQIGTRSDDPDVPRFQGLVDNVRVYNRAITEEEVIAHVKDEAVDHGLATRTAETGAGEDATTFFTSHPEPIGLQQVGNSILFANRRVGLELQQSERGFQLGRLYGIQEDQDYLTAEQVIGFRDLFEIMMIRDPRGSNRDLRHLTKGTLMGIMDEMAEGSFPIGSHVAGEIAWREEAGDASSTLHLEWKGMDVQGEKGVLDMLVAITLKENDPLSYWTFTIRNRAVRHGIERVRFPILPLAPIGEPADDVFIYPRERGGYVENPFNAPPGLGAGLQARGGYYPVNLNMQFEALYDQATGNGIYLGTRDPTPNLMLVQVANTPQEIRWRVNHFPPNITFAEEDFELNYTCTVGPFRGDWFDAAEIYRAWALQQSWSGKGPLGARDDVPTWYKEAPLMFYTVINDSAEGTHDSLKNVEIAADHFLEWVEWAGMPLPAVFYNWKHHVRGKSTYDVPFSTHRMYTQGRWRNLPCMNIHDGNYPKIGALENFSEHNRRLMKAGGMVTPYVALEIFDQGASENSPYAAEAKEHISRDLYGVMRTWGSETPWQPCAYTPWWQNRLRETATLMTRRENIAGFYLDVMQGSALPCYWVPHGHSAAGADMTTSSMHKLVEGVREAMKAENAETIITGENSTENMIDVIDGTLSVTLWPENKAPVFAAVYHNYFKRFGTEISTGVGYGGRFQNQFDEDAFYIECASMFVEGMQIGRIRLKPRDASLSLDKPGQASMIAFLSKVVDYYRHDQVKKFIVYGRVMRPLSFQSEVPLLTYRRGGEFPALMSGVFLSQDNELGIFVANASGQDMMFTSDLDPAQHGLAADAVVDVERIAPDGSSEKILTAARAPAPLEATLAARDITMFRVTPR